MFGRTEFKRYLLWLGLRGTHFTMAFNRENFKENSSLGIKSVKAFSVFYEDTGILQNQGISAYKLQISIFFKALERDYDQFSKDMK